MNVYIQELKMSARSAIYWTIGMISLLAMFMVMFPIISKDAALMQQVLSKFPPELARALGLNTLDMSTLTGYYAFLFTYILLIGAIYAMKSGISILSEEIREKTADFLITKPISRTAIVTAKIMSTVTLLLLQNIVFIASAFIVSGIVSDKPFDKNVFMLINVTLLLVQLFFIAFGLLLSVIMKKIKTVLPITMGVVFGFFILQLLNQSLADEKLAYITPFAYFDTAQIIETASLKGNFIAVNLALIIIFTAFTYIIYNKKDIPSV